MLSKISDEEDEDSGETLENPTERGEDSSDEENGKICRNTARELHMKILKNVPESSLIDCSYS